MIWGAIGLATLFVVVLTAYAWPQLRRRGRWEKAAFLVITLSGWLLAILLTVFPEMPGPTQMVDMIYRPLGRMFIKQ